MKPRQVPCFIITARATSSSPLEAYSTVVRRKQVFIVSLDRAEQGREPREHYRSPAAGRFAAPGAGLPAPGRPSPSVVSSRVGTVTLPRVGVTPASTTIWHG